MTLRTVEEILMDHQERMAIIRQQDRASTEQLAQINSLAIHGHSQEAIDKVKLLRESLLQKATGNVT